jgi:hypothetical protein
MRKNGKKGNRLPQKPQRRQKAQKGEVMFNCDSAPFCAFVFFVAFLWLIPRYRSMRLRQGDCLSDVGQVFNLPHRFGNMTFGVGRLKTCPTPALQIACLNLIALSTG